MDALFDNGRKLPLVEDFYTIQGEGYHSGKAAYFIRLGGCDIGCEWCDSRFSWDRSMHPTVDTDEIVKRAGNYPAKAVVVTGGEPSFYPLDYLCGKLRGLDIKTFIETSGTNLLSGQWDWICLSPKEHNPPLSGIFTLADELKVIVRNSSDLDWAEYNAEKVKSDCYLYLQPEWSTYQHSISLIVDYVKMNPKWRISLQGHKFMHIP